MQQITKTLCTKRLEFKQVSLGNLKDIHHLLSLPETDEFNTLGIPKSIEDTEMILREWIGRQNGNPAEAYIFCLTLVDTSQFIGLIALIPGKPKYKTAEVWFKIDVQYWNKGYTTEALKCLLAFGFNELGLHRIEAGCATENVRSIRVLEKAGMLKEGMKRKKLPIRGEWKDNYFYAILDADFK